MIQLADSIGNDRVVAGATDAPYELLAVDGEYRIMNILTGVVEHSGKCFLVEMLSMLEAYESAYKAYTKAGPVAAMMLSPKVDPRYVNSCNHGEKIKSH